MPDKNNPRPDDLRSAAQAALQAAQEAASGALRVPTASAQIVGQLPDLIENLAAAIDRLNATLDRFERYIALADPTLQAMDRVLPHLEALSRTSDAAFRAVSDLPGVGTVGRLTGLTPREAAAKQQSADARKRSSKRGHDRRRGD